MCKPNNKYVFRYSTAFEVWRKQSFSSMIPSIVNALIILIIGWVLAKLSKAGL
ncbi:MAG: hypothetical protein IPI96_15315 [Saprospiraceae bacterium]|nr:hypothetical protein [Saprospiraceae bacterium]